MQVQHTLRDSLEFSGVGLHTGSAARVRVVPQAADGGLRFRLIEAGVTFPASPQYVVETRRATVVGSGGATVSTVEHLLSALFAMGVDNAAIEVEGPEIPVLDGSAAAFVAAIARVGLVAQGSPRKLVAVDRPLVFRDGDALLAVAPAESFRVRFAVDFAPPVGAQFIDAAIDAEYYAAEIAPARTFGYLHEVEALLAAGLARGGSLDNALVFAPDGPLTPLRWPNEVVRHKVLDLIGDFALLGGWPQCDVVSIKSGHRLHARAVAALRTAFVPHLAALGEISMAQSTRDAMDILELMTVLPHRYPMLLVDRITHFERQKHATGYKNLTMNEHFFQGHFPGYPLMPGVYMIEALAQLGGTIILGPDDFRRRIAFLTGINKAKFRRPVVPGDRLDMEATLMRTRSNMGWVAAEAKVGGKLACAAELMFSVSSIADFSGDASILHQ